MILCEFDAYLPTTNAVPKGLDCFSLFERFDIHKDFHELAYVALQGF